MACLMQKNVLTGYPVRSSKSWKLHLTTKQTAEFIPYKQLNKG